MHEAATYTFGTSVSCPPSISPTDVPTECASTLSLSTPYATFFPFVGARVVWKDGGDVVEGTGGGFVLFLVMSHVGATLRALLCKELSCFEACLISFSIWLLVQGNPILVRLRPSPSTECRRRALQLFYRV